jgi:hypothetical protein
MFCIVFDLILTLEQLFNRILAPYVMNLDLNQVNYGIGQGASKCSQCFRTISLTEN